MFTEQNRDVAILYDRGILFHALCANGFTAHLATMFTVCLGQFHTAKTTHRRHLILKKLQTQMLWTETATLICLQNWIPRMQILNRNSYNIHPWHAISKKVPKTYNSGLRIKTIIKKQVYQKKNKGCHPNPKSTQFQVRISIELQKEEEEDYSYFRNTEIPIHQIQLEKKV